METNEIVSRLTPIFRDVFNDDGLVVDESITAADVPSWGFAFDHQHDHCGRKAFSANFSIKDVRNLKTSANLSN